MNKEISLYIVDDESLARERLKRLLEDYPEYRVCGEAENGEQALIGIEEHNPDIVLLDIRMPGLDGLEVARRLNDARHKPAIIFCTAYDQYAIEAFQHNAIGYLLKPARKEDLIRTLASAHQLNSLQLKQLASIENKETEDLSFVANTWKGQEVIPLEDIYLFRADQKYLTVVHTKGETISDQTLKELEQKYAPKFIRVHRNSLVNSKHLKKLIRDGEGHHQILLSDYPEPIAVSRRHVSDIKGFLSKL